MKLTKQQQIDFQATRIRNAHEQIIRGRKQLVKAKKALIEIKRTKNAVT